MIHPPSFDHKTGFHQVRALLAHRCLSPMGKELVEDLAFSHDFDRIRTSLEETREFLSILESGLPFPNQDYLDLSAPLLRIQTPGSWILREELADLRKSLATILECIKFFSSPSSHKFPLLKEKAGHIEISVSLVREIDKIIDEKGQIRDSASETLGKIRKEIRNQAHATEKIINQLLQGARNAGWTSDDAEITIFEGRLVIPVQAAYKRKIRGIVHDESATGHTVYLEPEACLEINNKIRELESSERREIIRILTAMSDLLRNESDDLFQAYQFLGELDFIRAKALMASALGAQLPALRNAPVMRWKNARHPLLFLAHQAKGKTVVPLDITLDRDNRILIITGPNAGGKSVCLKTAGLLQYMLQCGLLVPMDPDSEAGIFERIFIDIGDEQSLENDLSTYSSHLLNLKFFVENCNDRTLFLIDELGTGTDPSLGGALAEAAMEKLAGTGAFGVATTHYSNLKLLDGKIDGIKNGAMLFDMDELQPLYKMVTGKPGSSFTFEIAQRIGFPGDVIDLAKSKTGKTHLDFERQLQEVEAEKIQLEKQLQEFQVAESFLADLVGKYEKMKSDLEISRTRILEKAKEEAKDLLENSNRLIEKTIKEIRESKADKDKTKELRADIQHFKQEVEKPVIKAPANPAPVSPKPEPRKWNKGDRVSLAGRTGTGVILLIKGQQATVDFDGFKVSTGIDKLEPARATEKARSGPYSSIMNELNEKAVRFKLTLDVRGKSADEALQMTQKYLDDAYLLRIKEVNILHGKGEGILRKVIRNFLAGIDEVESFEDEHIERGGAGITKVFLK